MITYEPLNRLLAEKGISRTELAKKIDISSVTLAKLGKDESVNLTVIDKICVALNCSIEEVVKIIPANKEDYFANLDKTNIVRARIPGIKYSTFVITNVLSFPDDTIYVVRPVLGKRPRLKRNAIPLASYKEWDAVLDNQQITAFILNGPNTEFQLPSSQIQAVCGSVLYTGAGFAEAVMSDEELVEFEKTLALAHPSDEN